MREDTSTFFIETERLGLRALSLADCQSLFEILSDLETMRYYPRPYTREETEAWIARSMLSYRDKNFGLWAVILKKEDQFIGQCGISLQEIDGKTLPEIGYHIHKKYWRRGYASEAAKASLDYGFLKVGLPELFIHTSLENAASIRVAEKMGMKKRKTYDKVVNQASATVRHVVYALKKGALA